ncbi:hypothetical protein IHE45_03G064600, partial [Dioscorea alata]
YPSPNPTPSSINGVLSSPAPSLPHLSPFPSIPLLLHHHHHHYHQEKEDEEPENPHHHLLRRRQELRQRPRYLRRLLPLPLPRRRSVWEVRPHPVPLLPTRPPTPSPRYSPLPRFPFTGFLLFLTLYFAVVRNPSAFSRYVRFNTMQAIVLDVLLIFPDLLERTFNPRGGVALDFVMSLDSTVFFFLLVSLVYGSTSCLLGQLPRLPIVADAAERQVL